MKSMKIIIPILLLLVFNSSKGQSTSFYLKDINYLSDLNYKAIAHIDEYPLDKLIDSVFNVQRGKYTIYRFERISTSESKDNLNLKENKELIIVKVSENIIVEAYYCPLNWGEPPISHVFLVSQKEIRLAKKISTKRMKFKNTDPNGISILKDGVIKIVKR
jgi:hypothetical protein